MSNKHKKNKPGGEEPLTPDNPDVQLGMEIVAQQLNDLTREVTFYKTVCSVMMMKAGNNSDPTSVRMTKKDQLMIQGMGLMIGTVEDPATKEGIICIYLDMGEELQPKHVPEKRLVLTEDDIRREQAEARNGIRKEGSESTESARTKLVERYDFLGEKVND